MTSGEVFLLDIQVEVLLAERFVFPYNKAAIQSFLEKEIWAAHYLVYHKYQFFLNVLI